MADLKLFRLEESRAVALETRPEQREKIIQSLIERNMDTMLGVRFLATEFVTSHGGRIDSLGLDENNCPVIVEYKRDSSENVINQGLFYLDWLMDHQADFKLLAIEQLGRDAADQIEWTEPRLICIADDFRRWDEHAVRQINRNIELIRYKRYETDLVLLESLTAVSATATKQNTSNRYKTVSQALEGGSDELKSLYAATREVLLLQGEDIQEKTLKNYFAFQRIKNFACVEVRPSTDRVVIYVKVDPDSAPKWDNLRDVREIGHFGTGDLEVTITSIDDLERAKPLIKTSYENS